MRSSWILAAFLAVVTGGYLLGASGCQPQAQPPASPAENTASPADSASADGQQATAEQTAEKAADDLLANDKNGDGIPDEIPRLLDGWETPAAAFLLSGEAHGYLEPCGCSPRQSGGLSRRGDLFRQLTERGWSYTAFDLGGSLKRSRRQSKIKFEAMREALARLNYAAMAIGPEELALEVDYLFSLVPDATSPEAKVPYVTSNVAFYGTPDLGSPAPVRLMQVGAVKVGVTGVLGASYLEKIYPPQNPPPPGMLTVAAVDESITAALAKMEAESTEFRVLLSHASLEDSLAIAARFPQFQLILSAGGPEDPEDDAKFVGSTMVVTVGQKGKKVGVVGYYPGQTPAVKFERVELDMFRFKRSPAMEEVMAFYQERLANEGIVASMKPLAHSSGAMFVGAKSCGECHTKAFKKWSTTRHAKAYVSLEKGRENYVEGEWISRIHDPECLSCHVTGWEPQEVYPFESGFQNATDTPHLLGQQCENCHGPGSQHVEQEQLWKKERQRTDALLAQRQAMHLDKATVESKVCQRCHDYENSPKFEFSKYWKEVEHPWRD